VRHLDHKGRRWSRGYVNEQVNRIRRIFSWGTYNGLTDAATVAALRELPGLRKKRTDAPETARRKLPVDDAVIDRTLPHLKKSRPSVWRMVQVHRLIGCRASEIVTMRPMDLDTSGKCWRWTPKEYKTEGQGVDLYYWIGPKAQALLLPAIKGKAPGDWLFPTLRKRGEGRYTKDSYNRAIAKICKAHGIPQWSAGRLRHTAATAIKSHENAAGRHGGEGAKAVLRHHNLSMSDRYAKEDAIAQRIMGEIG